MSRENDLLGGILMVLGCRKNLFLIMYYENSLHLHAQKQPRPFEVIRLYDLFTALHK